MNLSDEAAMFYTRIVWSLLTFYAFNALKVQKDDSLCIFLKLSPRIIREVRCVLGFGTLAKSILYNYWCKKRPISFTTKPGKE